MYNFICNITSQCPRSPISHIHHCRQSSLPFVSAPARSIVSVNSGAPDGVGMATNRRQTPRERRSIFRLAVLCIALSARGQHRSRRGGIPLPTAAARPASHLPAQPPIGRPPCCAQDPSDRDAFPSAAAAAAAVRRLPRPRSQHRSRRSTVGGGGGGPASQMAGPRPEIARGIDRAAAAAAAFSVAGRTYLPSDCRRLVLAAMAGCRRRHRRRRAPPTAFCVGVARRRDGNRDWCDDII